MQCLRTAAPWFRTLLLGGLMSGLALGVGCSAAFTLPAEQIPDGRSREQLMLQRMNPFVLENFLTQQLIVEVDWVEGGAPDPNALASFEQTLRSYLPPDKQISILLGDEIPRDEWDGATGDFLERSPLLGPYLDTDPNAWEEQELLYVVYVPEGGEYVGWMAHLALDYRGVFAMVPTIFIFFETIASEASWPVTATRIERAVLIHELGHVFGLVSSPDHQERGNPRHCTQPRCVVTNQRLRTQLYNVLPMLFAGSVPHDFCERCRDDIRTARRAWAARIAVDPSFVDELRRRRRAWELRNEGRWLGAQERWQEASEKLTEARELIAPIDACLVNSFEQIRKPDRVRELFPCGDIPN